MKRILLPVLLFLCTIAYTQTNEQIYYYYKGQKVYFPVSYDRIVVGIENGEANKQMRSSISRSIKISEDSIIENSAKQLYIKIGRNKFKDISTITSTLRTNSAVKYIRPVFTSTSGKYNSYGENFIVKLKRSTSFAEVQVLMEKTGCSLLKRYPFQDDIYILAAGKKAAYDALAMANYFYETGLFEYAEPDKIVYDAKHAAPNDPLNYLQWAHKNDGTAAQYSGVAGADMKVQDAWTISMGSNTIKIGVIDEGVDLTHPDLQGNLLQGFNGQTMTSNPGDGAPMTSNLAHGTNCAGIIAAKANNGIGIAGVAPNCKIIPAVIFSETYLGDAAVAAAFDYVRINGADVISNSWGGGTVSETIDDAINRAVTLGRNGKGSIVLFSSGNENADLSYPGNNPQVIAVGGVNMCNQRKSPSSCDGENWWGANYGGGLDIVAPCVKVASTDIQGAGGYNVTTGTAGDYFNTFNGTSSAVPNAAGVFALILSVNPNLTATQAIAIIENSCDKIQGYNYAMSSDPAQQNGTWNNETGHGRVNALKALQLTSTGLFCAAEITSSGTTICSSPITLSVLNPDGGSTYQWRRNGAVVGTGSTYNTVIAGNYDVLRTKTNCSIASNSITLNQQVSVTATANPLLVCAGGTSILTANATVLASAYCAPTYGTGTPAGDFISHVSIAGTTLNSTTGASSSPFYTVYPQTGSTTGTLSAGVTNYQMTLKGGTYINCMIRAWIDFNQDGIFAASETIGVTGNVGNSQAGILNFAVPANAVNGTTRLRIRSSDVLSGLPADLTCGATSSAFGEAEDYLITINNGLSRLSYAWSESPAGNTLSVKNTATVTAANILQPVTYTITTTTNEGCKSTASVVINTKQKNKITGITAGANPLCGTAKTTLTATGVEGSNAVITWWSGTGGTGSKLGTGATLVNVGAGKYYARVTGDCGSPVESAITVSLSTTGCCTITCPGNISANSSGSCGAIVFYPVATLSSGCENGPVTYSKASGSWFPIGTTMVTVSSGASSCSFTVTIKDSKAPLINCPANITVNATNGQCYASVNPGTATATDNCGTATVAGTRSDGKALNANYPVGLTTITWKATDASGNTSTCQQKITVKDVQSPLITGLNPSPSILWPADRSMVNVNINYNAADNCRIDACQLSVTSNEPIGGTSTNDLSPDWQILSSTKLKLRAERRNYGGGRVYTVKVTCKDETGNQTVKTTTISVPITAPSYIPSNSLTGEQDQRNGTLTATLSAQLLPNPAERFFNLVITGGNGENVDLTIYDITGKLIQKISQKSGNIIQFGETLISGMYIIELRQGNEKVILKALKR